MANHCDFNVVGVLEVTVYVLIIGSSANIDGALTVLLFSAVY